MRAETILYDQKNLSGLGKEIVADIEVEVEYNYHHGYPATYMEPGAEDEVEIVGCYPSEITIEPVDIPESKDSLIFSRLMNFFSDGPITLKPEDLDPERLRRLNEFCADSQEEERVKDAAKKHSEEWYDDYPDDD